VKRETSSQRGYGYRWQQMSKGFLRAHPLCVCPECQEGKVRLLAATVVDHIIPHRGDMALFWDRNNWQAMNKQCHDRKTATEDGGFTGR
jgi:5-methylcytosine-specific restriction protein A